MMRQSTIQLAGSAAKDSDVMVVDLDAVCAAGKVRVSQRVGCQVSRDLMMPTLILDLGECTDNPPEHIDVVDAFERFAALP